MRFLGHVPAVLIGLACAMPAQAAGGTFTAGSQQVASIDDPSRSGDRDEGRDDEDRDDEDRPLTQEEIRERRRQLREEDRELRKEEREAKQEERAREAKRRTQPRAWIGLGAGTGWGSAEVLCTTGSYADCNEEGLVSTYSANVTLAGPRTSLRLRGIRDQDKGDEARTPYETAAMIGNRFGSSNWYGFVGYGRIRHVDDRFPGKAGGFAWEVVFAPSTEAASGFEMSFQGNTGHEVDFVAFNLGLRLGLLR